MTRAMSALSFGSKHRPGDFSSAIAVPASANSFSSLAAGDERPESTKSSAPSKDPSSNNPELDPGLLNPGNTSTVPNMRRIPFGAATAGHVHGRAGSNHVSTTKYELWNLIPKNLFEQFQRAANIWFLVVSICQMLPMDLSPTSKYATIAPLCCVLFVTFCKDAYEDYGRRRDDTRVNNQRCNVVEHAVTYGSKLREVRWKDVTVGQYLQLHRNEPVPADMVLLACSGKDGVAYVDTAQLDGETSLKPKFTLEETMRISSTKELLSLEGHMDAELPNQLVQSFNGTLFLRGFPRCVPIDAKNFMLRGATVRNTSWVFGLVVYTGYDTKLVQNLKKTPSKRSRVESTANYLLVIVFGCLVAAALCSAIARAIFLRSGTNGAKNMSWVWPEPDPQEESWYLSYITFMIGYNNLIPISLYVTSDLVRTFQAIFMERDKSMYHAETDSGCRVRNSGLNENLGQVEFVLTDKTGTLTENHMQFKACSVKGKFYGCWDEEKGPTDEVANMPPSHVCWPLDGPPLQWSQRESHETGRPTSDVMDPEEESALDDFFLCLATCHTAIVERVPRKGGDSKQGTAGTLAASPRPQVVGSGTQLNKVLKGEAPMSPNDKPREVLINEQGRLVLPEDDKDSPRYENRQELMKEAAEVKFRSPSPDEEALVAAARDYGFFFRKKVASQLTINVRGKNLLYNLLITNEFTSDRKRMSVLVRRIDPLEPPVSGLESPLSRTFTSERGENVFGSGAPSEGPPPTSLSYGSGMYPRYPAVLYAKGADNVMLERISKSDKQALEVAKSHIKQFSTQGLRTLITAKRELTDNQADYFWMKMQEAQTAIMNRETMVEKVANDLEKNLEILGVTAIEDRIQQGVPDTVNMLLRAGVKVWMLTGDNMETAVNIGIACKLIDTSMKQYKLEPGAGGLEEVDPSSVLNKLHDFYNHIRRQLKAERKPGDFKYCLVLHGKVLYTILEDQQAKLRQLFLAIACSSCAVIACRLAPAQKAVLVKLVRNSAVGSPLTLAIGDGGNDVSMIQEAHVGVGVLGVEGRQAANAADFVIGQFSFLQTMLFVHGRWNLRRIGIVIGYSFYKNFLLVLPLAFYANYTGFTGTTLYESYLLTSFNLVFTSLPVMAVGVLDKDVSASMALLVPSLYQLGIQRRYFNARTLVGWIVRGALHAALIFGTMQALFRGSLADATVPGGHVGDYLVMGSWAYWACITVANLTMMLHTKAWMDWQVLMVIGSGLVFLPLLGAYSDGDVFLAPTFQANMVGVAGCLFGHLRSWLGLFLVAAACSLSDLAVSFAKKDLAPDAADVLQEVQYGHVAGIECPASATVEERQARAREYFMELPPPPRKVTKLKPEGRVSIKPLPTNSKRKRPHLAVGASRVSVVPVDGDHEAEAERSFYDEPSIITVPETFSERVWLMLCEAANSIWQMQWTEMTVGELCGTLRLEQIEIPNHFNRTIMSQNDSVSAFRPEKSSELVERLGRGNQPERAHTDTQLQVQERHSVRGSQAAHHPRVVSHSDDHRHSNKGGQAHGQASRTSSNDSFEFSATDSEASNHSNHTDASADSKQVITDLMYSMVTLRFRSQTQEQAFCQFMLVQAVQMFRRSMLALCAVPLIYNVLELILRRWPFDAAIVRILICVGVLPTGALTQYFLRRGFFKVHTEKIIVSIVIIFILAKHIYDILTASQGILMNSYLPLFIIAGTRIRFTCVVLVFTVHICVIILRYWLLAGTIVVQTTITTIAVGQAPAAEFLVLMLGTAILMSCYCYQLEKLMRKEYCVLDSIAHSKHQSMEFLRGMFPEEVVQHVLERIGQNRRAAQGIPPGDQQMLKPLREDRGIVSIIFCDICDFDGLVDRLTPTELVRLLDLIWMMFDRILDCHGLVKIETVSSTYMAAAMPEETTASSAKRHAADACNTVLSGIQMLQLVSRSFTGSGKVMTVSARIGVHTGRAISGVVGSQKPQFALFGDTVNTASRMQSTGAWNCLHISGATHDLLTNDSRFEWEERQTQVKGKGNMTTYLLRRYRLEGHRWISTSCSHRHQALFPAHDLPHRHLTRSMSLDNRNHRIFSSSSCASDPMPGSNDDHQMEMHPDDMSIAGTFHTFDKSNMALAYVRHTVTSGVQANCAFIASMRWPGLRTILSFPCSWRRLLRELSWKDSNSNPMTGSPMWSQWVSLVSFMATLSMETLAQWLTMERDWELQLGLRWGYVAFALVVTILLYRAGQKHAWGSKNSKPLPAFSDLIAISVFIGFVCFSVANVQIAGDEGLDDNVREQIFFKVSFQGFFFLMVLLHLCRLHPQGFVPALLCILVVAAIITWVAMRDKELLFECIAYSVFVFITHVIAVLGDPRRALSSHKAIIEDHERVSELLGSMLPREVLAEMKAGNLSLAYIYKDMTFLFADIVGFTTYCAEHTAEQAVNLVTRLFAEFDEQGARLGIYKVCTIGDAYVVVNEPRMACGDRFGDCESVFTFGQYALETIVRVRSEVNHEGLDMRIGMHYGKFVGGLIGTKCLRFDIWGEDVLVGNSVESHGKAGKICVSEAAKEVLEHTGVMPLTFTFNVDIKLRTGRKIRTYICNPPPDPESDDLEADRRSPLS